MNRRHFLYSLAGFCALPMAMQNSIIESNGEFSNKIRIPYAKRRCVLAFRDDNIIYQAGGDFGVIEVDVKELEDPDFYKKIKERIKNEKS